MMSNRKLIIIVIAVIALISAILYGLLYRNNSSDLKIIEDLHEDIITLREIAHYEFDNQEDTIVILTEDANRADLKYLEVQLPIAEVDMNEALFLLDIVEFGNLLGELKLRCFYTPSVIENQSCTFNNMKVQWSFSDANGVVAYDLYVKEEVHNYVKQYHLEIQEELYTYFERIILTQDEVAYTETDLYRYEENHLFTYMELENDSMKEVYHRIDDEKFHHYDDNRDSTGEMLFIKYDLDENIQFKIVGDLLNNQYEEFVFRQKNDYNITLFTIRYENENYESIKYNMLYTEGWTDIKINTDDRCEVHTAEGEKALILDDCRINNYYMKERESLDTDTLTDELLDLSNDGVTYDIDFDRYQLLETEFLTNYAIYISNILSHHHNLVEIINDEIDFDIIDNLNP